MIVGDGLELGGAGMSRRGGRWTQVTLRLGLLLGGVVAVWGVHEAATTAVAYAADRPSAVPVDAAVDMLTGVLRPILTTTPPPAPEVPTDEPARRTTPGGSGLHPAPGRPPARPTSRPASRPANQDHPTAGSRVQVGTPKFPVDGARRPAARPRGETSLTPVSDVLRPVTGPVRTTVITPVSKEVRPITSPVQVGVLAPAADVLSPVAQPLAPIFSPVWRGLEPVLEPLDPVLETLDPVTDPLDPPNGPPATPLPTPALPASPASGTVGGSANGAGPGCCTGPGTEAVSEAARSDSSYAPMDWHSAKLSSPQRLARSDRPHLPPPNADSTPATPAPGTSGSGSPSTVHGDPADALTSVWTPSLAEHRCHPTGSHAIASHSSRPGTRPA
ncbi:hypothetical protein ABT235_23130 [Micromonospora echinofusca]|uniref:hypothetical protein n=1 Tax=Micromonospora echinofusca TaxID=47858 RepID=UPI0011835E01|nr:hypothetical protein [Micromonospora sp. MSM11]MCL7456378.1 hypothetical protein [Micromonospora sp. MSM11]